MYVIMLSTEKGARRLANWTVSTGNADWIRAAGSNATQAKANPGLENHDPVFRAAVAAFVSATGATVE